MLYEPRGPRWIKLGCVVVLATWSVYLVMHSLILTTLYTIAGRGVTQVASAALIPWTVALTWGAILAMGGFLLASLVSEMLIRQRRKQCASDA